MASIASELIAIAAGLLSSALAMALVYRGVFAAAWVMVGRHRHTPLSAEPHARFAVLIPAHNEELLIAEGLRSIASARYPSEKISVFVIADNCTDATVQRAKKAGATVFERVEPNDPGKGQALHFGLQRLNLDDFDAVCFIDADNLVDENYFAVMEAEIVAGARILQGYDGLSNPGESRLTRLMAVTSVMKNLLFYGGKRTLGLSSLLMGTGMVFVTDALRKYGWVSFSIGEDLEQSFSLLESGERIQFVPNARVLAQEAVDLKQAYVQRQRWATGRRALSRRARSAMGRGLRSRSVDLFDSGLEMLLPTYSATISWWLFSLLLSLLASGLTLGPLVLVGCVGIAIAAEVGLALFLMQATLRELASFVLVPVFLVWKVLIDILAAVGFRSSSWTRTERHRHD